ncbi:conserved hypothetical protein [uncultured Sporomusa sp.]|uniref:Uncharacterized protein n=1 Tax=uncultured Sporomusa sp. TaxID=307249 RepID=A0A212LXY5_9FIRM|nr:SIR2 family protein [uncultured Sporomusa sp.]SCM82366.1 conserved hypothetical protein [uncultured Sporomusa sp.]
MSEKINKQIIKCREDAKPIVFLGPYPESPDNPFQLDEGVQCSWVKNKEFFNTSILRKRIEPWLTALVQSEHLSLLVGSGLSNAVHLIATDRLLPGMSQAEFSVFADQINENARSSAIKAGRNSANIEDQIRVANELLRGLEILGDNEATDVLKKEIKIALNCFASNILQGENGLVNAETNKREEAFTYLVSFLMGFASRNGTRDRLQIYTTNYDRFIEAGADIAGLHLLDRFAGALNPIFRSSRLEIDMHYNPPGIRGEPRYLEGVARYAKLHGSLDWINIEQYIRRIGLPLGAKDITPYLEAPGIMGSSPMELMIYPNSAKDRETASYPYVDLFRDFSAGICRPNSTLFTYGYSFGDEHINRVIEDMLTIPSTHLVIISYDDPLGRIMQTYHKLKRPAQITLLLGNHFGDLKSLVDNYLPKPAIDRTMLRMAKLLEVRWGNADIANASKAEGEDAL